MAFVSDPEVTLKEDDPDADSGADSVPVKVQLSTMNLTQSGNAQSGQKILLPSSLRSPHQGCQKIVEDLPV